jgi:ABC-type phosphate/phosphonate transport system substrate-binding protein
MASSRLASSVRQRLTAALLAVREGERGEATPLFEASRFEPVSEGHLDLLRRLSRFDETRA